MLLNSKYKTKIRGGNVILHQKQSGESVPDLFFRRLTKLGQRL